MANLTLTLDGANNKAHDWLHVQTPLTEIQTWANETKFDYDNISSKGIYTSQVKTQNVAMGSRLRVWNNTSGTIEAGDLVYFSGTFTSDENALPTVAKAVAHATASSAFPAQGIMVAPGATGGDPGSEGTVLLAYEQSGENTSGGNIGDPVYLDTTAGGWTRVRPTGVSSVQCVGSITNVDASTGRIFFNFSPTERNAGNLDDIDITQVGTIGTGVWEGTKVASAYLDDQTAHLDETQTFSGAKTFSAAATLATGSTIGTLTLADGSITDSSGAITFVNENLVTTGTLAAGVATLATGSTIGNLTLADGSITDSSGSITFVNENLATTGTLSAGVATLATGSTIGNLTFANGSITDSSGSISMGDENLSTTGTLSAGATTIGGTLDFNSGTIDLSTQTVDVTLNAAVDALNFDSNTLSIDATNNRVGIGTAVPAVPLEASLYQYEIMRASTTASTKAGWISTAQATTVRTFFGHQDSDGGGLLTGGIANAGVVRGDAGLHLVGSYTATVGATITAAGRLGIGTIDPAVPLDVSGSGHTAKIGKAGTAATWFTSYNDGNTLHFGVEGSSDGGAFTASSAYAGVISSGSSSHALQFATSGTVRATISNTGKVGIGTAAPSRPLTVEGTIGINSTNPQIAFSQSGTEKAFLTYWSTYGASSTGTLGLTANTGAGLHFDPTNIRVGINTTAPTQLLHLAGAATAPQLLIEDTGNNTATLTLDGDRVSADQETGKIFFNWNNNNIAKVAGLAGTDTSGKANGQLSFQTASAGGSVVERMRINQDGKIDATSANKVAYYGKRYTFDLLTLIDDADVTISAGNTAAGLLLITEHNSGDNAMYYVGYGSSPVLMQSNGSNWASADTDGKYCVIIDGYATTFKNRVGVPRTFSISLFSAGMH